MENTPRIRINAKQTSKGEWYLDVTAETDDTHLSAQKLEEAIKATEEIFHKEGRVLVGST